MAAIVTEDLTKDYKKYRQNPGLRGTLSSFLRRRNETVRALDHLTITIEEGEVVGFLGPNGAGKSTTMKMLAGILYPSSGVARVGGFTPWERKNAFKKQISLVMGQKQQLWWDLPAMDTFLLMKDIYRVPDKDFRQRLDDLVDILQVGSLIDVQARRLSLGERMKMELIASLLHYPRILFLDEPTIGLDVVAKKALRDFIRSYNRATRTTILLTSHYLDDVRHLCERVIVIDHGKLAYDGSLSRLTRRFADYVVVRLRATDLSHADLSLYGDVVERQTTEAAIHVDRSHVASVASEITRTIDLDDVLIEEPPIDDVVRDLFQSPTRVPDSGSQ